MINVRARSSNNRDTMFPLALHQLSLLAILLLTPLFIALKIRRGSVSDAESRLPPSPRGLPIVGNLHQVGSLPHRSLRSLSEKHGPLMLLRMGRVPTLVVSSADAAREVMKTRDLVFASRPPMKVTRLLLHDRHDLVFAPYSEYWRQLRKICVTHLLSNKMVQSFQPMREEEVKAMLDKVLSQAAANSAIDMSEVLNSLTYSIICRSVLGKFSMGAGWNLLFREMVEENMTLLAGFHVEDNLPSLGWMDAFFGGLTARAERNSRRWHDVLDQVIDYHANQLHSDGADQHGGFVQVLLSLQKNPGMHLILSNENIKALLMDMFVGGIDTSYILLEWTLSELIRSPKVMKKLQDEVRGSAKGKSIIRGEDLGELRYLKAVLMEVLRLHPPAPLLVPRESMEDCIVQGYKVPKQTRVLINCWAIGRDPKSWEAPEEFQPERFIDSPVDFRGNDFQFIPFGAGRRICPGMNFGVATSELALANLIHRFNWMLPNGMRRDDLDMAEAPGLTTRKKQRLELVAKPVFI